MKFHQIIVWIAVCLVGECSAAYSPWQFKSGSDDLLKNAMDLRAAQPPLFKSLQKMQVEPRLAATLASLSAMRSREQLADQTQELSAETVEYIGSVYPRVNEDLMEWESTAQQDIHENLSNYRKKVHRTINMMVGELDNFPDIAKGSVLPATEELQTQVKQKMAQYKGLSTVIDDAVATSTQNAVSGRSLAQTYRSAPQQQIIFNISAFQPTNRGKREYYNVMKRPVNPNGLNPSNRFLEKTDKAYLMIYQRVRLTDDQVPLVNEKSLQHIQKVNQQASGLVEYTMSPSQHGQVAQETMRTSAQLHQMKLDTIMYQSEPRQELLDSTMPPRVSWEDTQLEVDKRIENAREVALRYDIQRPVYTSYGTVIEEVTDTRRYINSLLPLLQYRNCLAFWLLLATIPLLLLAMAGLACRRVRKIC